MSKSVLLDDFRASGQGSTILCYSQSDDTWACGDSGGAVHTLTKDNTSSSRTASDSSITSMAVSPAGDLCAISMDKHLDIFEFPAVENSKFEYAVRTALDITHTAYEKDGKHIFVSSKGPDVEIYSCENENIEMKLATQNGGVRTFAITDDSGYICIADDSSAVLIYSLQANNSPLGKSFVGSVLETQASGITSTSIVRENFSTGFKVSWMPHNKIAVVAVPSANGITTVFHRKNGTGKPVWEEVYLTTSPSASVTHGTENINIAAFSPNGRYLATADSAGVILIWDVLVDGETTTVKSDTFSPISMFNIAPKGPLFDLVWGPKEGDNYLVLVSPTASGRADDVVDTTTGRCAPTGAVTALPKPVVAALGPQTATKSYPPYRQKENSAVVSASKETLSAPTPSSAAASTSSSVAPKFSRLEPKNTATADDDDDNLLDLESSPVSKKISKKPRFDDSDEENDDVIEVEDDAVEESEDTMEKDREIASILRIAGGDSSRGATGGVGGASEGDVAKMQASIASLLAHNLKVAKTSSMGPQAAFQSACTSYDEKRKRYLVWNSIGNITCMESGVNNRIEIRFTNAARNRGDAFNDNYNFTMAALAYEGALFASAPEDKDDNDRLSVTTGSTVYYYAFPGQATLQGANETFTVTLNNGEAALAVAVGEGWAAVATSSNLLRIYSSTGIPLSIISLKGPVTCMSGYIHNLAVYYYDNGQRVEIFEIAARDNVRKSVLTVSVPLSPASQLEWVGYDVTSETLVTLDTSGMMRVLTCSMGWQWSPVLDLNAAKKTADHRLWPVTVKGNRLSHVLLNGESRPATFPQPVTSMKNFRMPITETREGTDRGAAQNERVHQLLWDATMTTHFEALKGVEITTAVLPEGMTSSDLQQRLEDQERACDTAVLTLFQIACKQQRTEQSLDYAHRLRTDQGLSSAVQLANHFGRANVARAVEELLRAKQQMAEEHAQQQQGNNVYYENDENHFENSEDQGFAQESRCNTDRRGNREDIEEDFPSTTQAEVTPVVKKQPVNPFAAKSSPTKRKNGFENIRDLKGSPSPKKPTLMRQSSFAQKARSSVSKSKNLL